jgi:integrase
MSTWTSAEMRQFLAGTSETRFGAAWRLVLTTGCRRGEVAALRWRHVDLERATVSILSARVKAGARTVEGSPKSKASTRTISIDPKTVASLRQWKARQTAERMAAGPAWSGASEREDDFVMTNEIGEPLAPKTITRWWSREVMRLGLPVIRLHDARHTYATVAIVESNQTDKVISHRLGHSDIATTLRLYAHVREQDDRRAADAVAGLLD